ncbi:hypothetical protein AAFF_G00068230 [Aldrovandia affinis]|uniref:Link domain-containing protein n=1 Tax=Aldrovandia affinis TaxID=143900 RepID=A0AAD7RZQ6_9TELE|nr:hypothetical protein AAFF_G00068230 [Aldrovandia affinis]
MAGLCFLLCHLLSLAISALAVDPSNIEVFPESGRVSGVFLAFLKLNKNPVYAFNASQARLVCQSLHVVIASKAQVQKEETCRFGWIDEEIAVLPRITPSMPCGQERVGVIPWKSVVSRLFDAFCFNSSDIKTEVLVTTINVPTTSKPMAGAPSSPSPTLAPLPHTPPPLPPTTQSAPPPPPSLASTLSPLLSTSTSPPTPPSFPPLPPSTAPPPPRSTPPAPLLSAGPSYPPGVVSTALLVLASVLLLLAGVFTLWYHRRTRIFPFWKRGQRKEDTETEVWENFCQTDLKEQQTDIELDGCRNNSNDIRQEEGPETKAGSP